MAPLARHVGAVLSIFGPLPLPAASSEPVEDSATRDARAFPHISDTVSLSSVLSLCFGAAMQAYSYYTTVLLQYM